MALPSLPSPPSLLDLTHPLVPGMQVYPGDPEFRAEPALDLVADGVAVTALHLGTHTGTHVDAPAHVVPGGAGVGELDLELFRGPAVTADVRGLREIGPADLPLSALGPGVVLVVCTGWSARFGTPGYLDHPWLTADAARAVVDLGVRAVGVDTLSPDRPDSLAVHQVVLGAGGVLVENLRGVERLLGRSARVSFPPLALTGDGSPVRALAEV
jgi:kynurenine formamidase